MFTALIALILALAPAQHDYDGSAFMHEDEAPYTSPLGGTLEAYADGQAWYADGCYTQGLVWSCA